MFGGALGGATTSVMQGILVLAISLVLGFRIHDAATIPVAILILGLLALGIACFSSAIGSIAQDMQGFQAINQFLVFPLYFLSGALYPLNHVPTWLRIIAEVNPLSYSVDALRWSLLGQSHFGIGRDIIVLVVTIIVCATFATYRFHKIEA
jgi:ABC-2 type transport system permease protein